MELDLPRAWFRLRFRIRHDGIVAVGWQDDVGNRARPPLLSEHPSGWQVDAFPSPGGADPVTFLVPEGTGAALAAVVDRLEGQRAGAQLPAAVPVLVDAPPELALLPWERVVRWFLRAAPPAVAARVVVVLERAEQPEPAPFTLPLRILTVGDTGSEALAHLRQGHNSWLRNEDELAAAATWCDSVRETVEHLATTRTDLLIVDARTATRLRRARPPTAVLLTVVLGTGYGGPTEGLGLHLPWSRNVLHLTQAYPGPPYAVVDELLVALSHDLPLHDAVREALMATDRPPEQGRLSGSATSLHDLRLIAVWEEIERETARLRGTLGSATIRSFEAVAPEAVHRWSARTALHSWTTEAAATGRLLPDLGSVGLAFTYEREGLLPLSDAQAHLELARDLVHDLAATAPPDPEQVVAVPRVVNLGLRRSSTGVSAAGSFVYADSGTVLAVGRRYTLDVQIGAPWPQTLVTGPTEPVDHLLPDPRAVNELSVSVFSDTVVVDGPRTQPLPLPATGASPLVSFPLRATGTGDAWLRLSVYHRDNLLQTFRLRARVAQEEGRTELPLLAATLEHSGTRAWQDVTEHGPRAASLTINDTGSGHRIFLKRDQVSAMAPVSDQAADDAAREIRAVLTRVVDRTVDPGQSVRELAAWGSELYWAVFNQLDEEAKAALTSVSREVDLPVQVVRAHLNAAVPWALVYDWDLPEDWPDGSPPDTCLGTDAQGGRCGHGPDSGVICVRGFWGLRHQLEELLSDPAGSHPPPIDVTAGGAVLALGVDDDNTTGLASDLEQLLLPGKVRRLGVADRFLTEVFAPQHPGVVVVLGHFERTTPAAGPAVDSIALGTAERLLSPKPLSQSARRAGGWRAPRPLVLLLACGSTAVQARTLTSFLGAFTGAAAAAIVGTECDVYTDQAREFTAALLRALRGDGSPTGPVTYAAAVQRARNELVTRRGDVSGLVFDAFGPAELTFA
ncbi:hypothetical protein [Georgenia sp. H159]|uniref:hypothetical protein n=1 Tax=Georgenia sp. H159 TaxID=3076115 RepID=UPI002D7912D3|nr:hypothetical protein [Georgenia sp. H159]